MSRVDLASAAGLLLVPAAAEMLVAHSFHGALVAATVTGLAASLPALWLDRLAPLPRFVDDPTQRACGVGRVATPAVGPAPPREVGEACCTPTCRCHWRPWDSLGTIGGRVTVANGGSLAGAGLPGPRAAQRRRASVHCEPAGLRRRNGSGGRVPSRSLVRSAQRRCWPARADRTRADRRCHWNSAPAGDLPTAVMAGRAVGQEEL